MTPARVTQRNTASNQARPNVIIQLPPGPLFRPSLLDSNCKAASPSNGAGTSAAYLKNAKDDSSSHRLAELTSSTLVTINYRLGPVASTNIDTKIHNPATNDTHLEAAHNQQQKLYQFPTPIHDTLAGLDWVLQNLKPNRLGVIGTHIGGSLALMLALTEAQSIHAVTALEPVCDWTSLDEYCISSQPDQTNPGPGRRRKTQIYPSDQALPDLIPLLEARETLFATPERYFDAFASPLLFLRSAGKDVPKHFPQYLTGPEYPIPLLKKSSVMGSSSSEFKLNETRHNSQPELHPDLDSDPAITEGTTPRRRKALSRWPPYGLDYGVSGAPSSFYRHHDVKRLEVTLPHIRLYTRQEQNEGGVPPSSSSSSKQEKQGRETKSIPSTSRNKNSHQTTVLSRQAGDMVDVMRRACFWGREKGFGEERVTVFSGSEGGPWPISGEVGAGEWLRGVLGSGD